MKQVCVALIAVLGIGFGATAASAQSPYFGNASVSASPSTVAPGGEVTVTVQNCVAGTDVVITLEASSATAACSAPTTDAQGFRAPAQTSTPGTAVGTVDAPTTPGTYTGSAALAEGAALPFTVTVATPTSSVADTGDRGDEVTADLPATGGGIEPLTIAAIVLLIAGVGLVVVTRLRRRQARAAS